MTLHKVIRVTVMCVLVPYHLMYAAKAASTHYNEPQMTTHKIKHETRIALPAA